jgi:hypothetical protein
MVCVAISCHVSLLSYVKYSLIAESSDIARATTNSVFPIGAGTIIYSDVSCIGNESDILNCSRSTREKECNHFQEAGVDCQTCTCNLVGVGVVGGRRLKLMSLVCMLS